MSLSFLNFSRTWGLVFCLLATTAFAGVSQMRWTWTKSELRDIKKMAKDVTQEENGQFRYEGETWIVYTEHSANFTAQVAKYMRMFSEIFHKAFMLKREYRFKDVKPQFFVYQSKAAYMAATGAHENSGGRFSRRWQKDRNGQVVDVKLTLSTYFETDKKEPLLNHQAPLRTIQHEATHCLLQRIFGAQRIPKWLNEGTAEYYESWNIRRKISSAGNSKKDVAARNERRALSTGAKRLRHAIKNYNQGNLPRMDYLVSLKTSDDWDNDNFGARTSFNYCLSQSFIDFLMHRRGLREYLMTILERCLDDEKEIVTVDELLEYEKDWLQYLEKRYNCSFSKSKIKARVKELKERKKERNKADK